MSEEPVKNENLLNPSPVEDKNNHNNNSPEKAKEYFNSVISGNSVQNSEKTEEELSVERASTHKEMVRLKTKYPEVWENIFGEAEE